jgi:hypothetical protein
MNRQIIIYHAGEKNAILFGKKSCLNFDFHDSKDFHDEVSPAAAYLKIMVIL